jgi:phosphatidylglycerol:prolipoprotein diacylglycerol transferase
MYLVAFSVVFRLLKKRLRLGEGEDVFKSSCLEKNITAKDKLQKKQELLLDFLFFCFLGAVIGGRLGYVFFYDFSFYLAHPLAIISPFDSGTGELIGIYGMSYHCGLIGALSFALFFARKHGLNFWALSDFVVPVIPAGYFFGRVGNFFNGELYGRATEAWFGMYFPSDILGILRHPSQLYEAFLEGFLLFLFFWNIRNKKELQGKFLALYLMGYATMRFLGEFFREPDAQIGFLLGKFTLGQLFSVGMLLGGLLLLFTKKQNHAIINKC